MVFGIKKEKVGARIQGIAQEFFPDLRIAALDIGARGGLNGDLEKVAPLVDYYGFEPDPEEYNQLVNKKQEGTPWRSVRYIPSALYSEETDLALNLYRQRGCSSVLEADQQKGAKFSRGDYYIHEGTVDLAAKPLDVLLQYHDLQNPAFMKIDVQGLEVECFKGARGCLSDGLVALRTEVSFLPLYKGQPLFAEVEQHLRPFGFVPMRFLEFHEWRRETRVKYPHLANGDIPFSYGQMIHGDVLFMRSPESFDDSRDSAEKLARLGLIALCYEHFDHAIAVFQHPALINVLDKGKQQSVIRKIGEMSRKSATLKRRFASIASKLGFL